MNGNTLKKLPFIIFLKKIEKKFGLLKKCLYLCIVKQIKTGYRTVGSTPHLGCGGREFESRYPDNGVEKLVYLVGLISRRTQVRVLPPQQ